MRKSQAQKLATESQRLARTVTALATVPASEEEFLARWLNDARYFAETALQIRVGGNPVPWLFNRTQNRNFEELYREMLPGRRVRWILDDIEGKGRQRGGSTERELYLFHAWCFGGDFGPAFVGKSLAFADDTAQKLKHMVDLFYSSALQMVERVFACDPYDILPRADVDNVHELRDSRRGCALHFRSERTKGQGRAETANAVYITDLSEWTTYEEAIAGYAGSLSQTGREWVDRDFTGKGPGNAAHREYQKLKSIMLANPNGRTRARFFGRDDIDYPAGHLETALQRMGARQFNREFPKDEAAMFTGDPNARFDQDWIDLCTAREPRYLVEFMTDAEINATCVPCHAIDSAEGTPGGDFACIKTRDAVTGLEIMPPYHKRATPDDTVEEMKQRHARFPGLINPLRKNHGSAIISGLNAAGLGPWLYRQTDMGNQDGKIGLDENGATVPVIQTRYEIALKNGAINLPSENGRTEVTIFGLQKNGKIEAPPGFHDDEIVTDMACVTVFPAAIRKHAAMSRPPAPFVQQSARPTEWQ